MSLAYEQKAVAGLEQLGLEIARKQLDTVGQQAAAAHWSYSHYLGYLLDGELQERHRKTVELNLKFSKIPVIKRLEEFDFTAQPSIDRRLVDELATGRYLHEGRNLVLLGPPGVGTMPGPGLCRMRDSSTRERRFLTRHSLAELQFAQEAQ